ncbi:unannotated protein [freshwater metagenome]|uniref:Unannotated protein n=1 Tax=freshwater metagenome TaxID=449393 RepID=A0A6J6QRS9_9ZZZZ
MLLGCNNLAAGQCLPCCRSGLLEGSNAVLHGADKRELGGIWVGLMDPGKCTWCGILCVNHTVHVKEILVQLSRAGAATVEGKDASFLEDRDDGFRRCAV